MLRYPQNGQTIDTLIPEYQIDTCNLPGVLETHIQIAPNPDMSNWVLSLYTSPTGIVAFQSWENLEPGITYFWRVRARYSNEIYGPYSSGKFTTAASGLVLPPPTLLSPPDNSGVPGTTATFKWAEAPGAEWYQIVIHWTDTWGSTAVYIPVYGTDFSTDYLPTNNKVTWKVASVSHYAIGPFSPVRTLSTGPGSAPEPGLESAPPVSVLDMATRNLYWTPGSQAVKVIQR